MQQFFISDDISNSHEEVFIAENAEDAANAWAERQQDEGVQGETATIYVRWKLKKPRKLRGQEKRDMGVEEVEFECEIFDVELPEFPLPIVSRANSSDDEEA